MSSSNMGANPSFNFFLDQQFLSNAPLPLNADDAWSCPDLQSVQPRISSPISTVGTSIHGASLRPCHRGSYPQPTLSPVDVRVEFHGANDFQQLMQNQFPVINPIAHWNQKDRPWNPTSNLRTAGANTNHDHASFTKSPAGYGITPSLAGEIAVSDSGYYTHRTPSVFSVDPVQTNSELPPSAIQQAADMNTILTRSNSSPRPQLMSDQRSQVSRQSERSGKSLDCAKCGIVSKCPSDFKKHQLKHDKPFACDIFGCKRTEGFTTSNDLDRHKRSVHRIGLENGLFKCTSRTCQNKEKQWPRLDNFKQHLQRRHSDEDHDELIRRWQNSSQDAGTAPLSAIAPADTGHDVAGMDTEIENVPSLPLRDEYPVWPILDHNLQGSNIQEAQLPGFYPGNAQPALWTSQPHYPNTLQPSAIDMNRSVSEYTPIRNQQLRDSRKLSSASHSKVDQLRIASQKSKSKVVRKSPSNTPPASADLAAVLQLLVNAQDADTEGQAESMIEALKDHIKTTQASKGKNRPDQAKPCPQCPFKFRRMCDLKKHVKRHSKPYGCTFPGCHKHFGAKSDWKRHENSQHFQQEVFRCIKCGQFEHHADKLRDHLRAVHKVTTDNELDSYTSRSRVGKNYLGTFWCGFCERIEKLDRDRNEAWDERFDHIAKHFEKDQKRIEDWLCLETKVKKGAQTRKSCERQDSEDGDGEREDDDLDAEGEEDDASIAPCAPTPSPLPPPPPPPHATPARSMPQQHVFEPTGRSKRRAQEDAPEQRLAQRQKLEIHRYCCECEDLVGLDNTQTQCMKCWHHVCPSCPAEEYLFEV